MKESISENFLQSFKNNANVGTKCSRTKIQNAESNIVFICQIFTIAIHIVLTDMVNNVYMLQAQNRIIFVSC